MLIMKDPDIVLDTNTSVGGIGTPRWSAPELLDPPVFGFKSCQPSKESDCYSFGMTIYEVSSTHNDPRRLVILIFRQILTGKVPFHDVRTDAVMMRIVRGIRPERPPRSHMIGFTDPVWTIVEGCWKESCYLRPDAPAVVGCLVTAAAQWTPTSPPDDPRTRDESETFSLLSVYGSSECTHASSEPREFCSGQDLELTLTIQIL